MFENLKTDNIAKADSNFCINCMSKRYTIKLSFFQGKIYSEYKTCDKCNDHFKYDLEL